MADVKIKDLPLAAASGSSVVPVMNPAGTATNSVTLASIAAIGGGPPATHAATHGSSGTDPISPSAIGAAQATHSHGNITSDGSIGSVSGLPVLTGTSGALTVGAFGTDAGTFCEGNDSRLTGARTPTAHAANHAIGGSDELTYTAIGAAPLSHSHGGISNSGAIGTTSGLPVITTTAGVLTTGVFGSVNGTFCEGGDSRLSDARTPTSHASSHAANGTDALTLSISQVGGLQAALDGTVASNVTGINGAVAVTNMVKVTQAQYDAINAPSSSTLYLIVG